MNWRRLWSTATIRLAVGFSLIFGVSCALLVMGVELALYRFVEREVRADLTHQMRIIREDEARLGSRQLVATLQARAHHHTARRYLFLVVAPDGQQFSNGLAPSAVNAQGFRRNSGAAHKPARWPDQRPNMLVLGHTTADGTLLAIGRDIQHLDELMGAIRRFTLWSSLGAIALALLAGLATGWRFLQRLEGVNAAIERVSSGDPSGRLPAIGFGREFDDLATSLNRMLERQEAMMDMLKTVSEGIAHDLRTPLGRLRNRLEELAIDAHDPDIRAEIIERALQEIDQITGLFESLLSLARIESGTHTSPPQPLDARELVGNLAEIYAPLIEDAGGSLCVTLPDAPSSLPFKGDRHLLSQALANLIDNAIVHTNTPREIEVGASQSGATILFTVADNGPGIPAAERAKVTKRFYRMDRSRTRQGSGIGLAMAQAVAHWHGGTLHLLDNAPGLRVELRVPVS